MLESRFNVRDFDGASDGFDDVPIRFENGIRNRVSDLLLLPEAVEKARVVCSENASESGSSVGPDAEMVK